MRKILTHDFILIFFAQFAFSFVFFILIPTVPIYLSSFGATEAEIGVLIGALGVSSLILRPFVGKALLKVSEKRFMSAGALLYAFSSIGYLLVTPFWPLLIVRILQGAGLAFFTTASFTLIANITPQKYHGQSISYFYLSINTALALAPYSGMFLVDHFNFRTMFLVCIGLSVCCLIITTKIERLHSICSDSRSMQVPILNRDALPPAMLAFMVNIIWGTLTAFFPLYAKSHGITNSGLFFGVFAIMLILGRSFGGKLLDIYTKERIILPCLTTYIISMLILAFSTTLPMFILVAMIWGIGAAFLYPALVAYALDQVDALRGSAMGTFTAMADLGIGVGPVMMGIVLQITNYPTMFLLLSLTGTINLAYFYFFVRKNLNTSVVRHK